MYKLIIICLCFNFNIFIFAQDKNPISTESLNSSFEALAKKDNKISVLKASYNSWNNDISEPDCRAIGFSFASEIIQSENIILKSREQWEHCQQGKTGITCKTFNPGPLYEKSVRIEIHPALKMYPWEYNRFKVCLKGANFSIKQIKTSYNYNISRSHIGDTTLFTAKPGQKIKMDPDINGLSVKSVKHEKDVIVFKLADKWSKYYSGKTEIKMSLFKESFWLLKDKYMGKYSSTDFSNDEYEATFSKEVTGELKPGKYYIKWSFRRIGDNVSNSILIDKGETEAFKVESAK